MFVFGGLSKSMIKYLQENKENCVFRKGFFNKDGVKSILDKTPVYFLNNIQLGLEGAIVKAKEIIK